MGMDVFGKQATADQGRYFRASVWMWAPLHEQMCRHCGDLLDEELLEAMAYNGGAGPDDQATCTAIADRLEHALAEQPDGFVRESTALRVTQAGLLVSCDPASAQEPLETRSPFRIRRSEVLAWIGFLRSCGGFAVW